MSRVLLTGSEGYIAGYLKPLLVGHEVLSVDLKLGDDIADPAMWDLHREFAPDIVIHLAGLRPIEAASAPERALRVNLLGTVLGMNFASSLAKPPIFIFASSYLATGTGIYGLLKRAAELLGMRYAGFRVVRFGSVVSRDKPSGFSAFYRSLVTGPFPVTVPVAPPTALPLLHPADAAAAVLALAFAPSGQLGRACYEIYGARIAPSELADQADSRGGKPRVLYRPELGERYLGGASLEMDRLPAQEDLAWTPRYGERELLEALTEEA